MTAQGHTEKNNEVEALKAIGGVDKTLMMLLGMAFWAALGLGLYSVFR
jgi:hypothetical protein